MAGEDEEMEELEEGAAAGGTAKLFQLELSEADTKGFCAFFRSLPEGPGGAPVVRFFSRKEGAFHTVHGEAATWVAKALYRTSSALTQLGGGGGEGGAAPLPGCTLNRSLYEHALRSLLLDGAGPFAGPCSVELWEERRGTGWTRVKAGSPGRLGAWEEELFRASDQQDAPVLAAVRLLPSAGGGRTVGLAHLHATSRELGATAFADDDAFSQLEAALAQLGAKEVVLPAMPQGAAQQDARRVREALARAGCLVSELKAADFSPQEAERALRRLLKPAEPLEMHRALLEREAAAGALGGLIRFAELEAEAGAEGRYSLAHHDTGKHMRLDGAALRALHVLKERSGDAGGAADSFSLYTLLNRCRTPMGKRLLGRWLKQPLVCMDDINARLDCVEALAGDSQLREALRSAQLKSLPDVERLAHKLERRQASLQDLCRLYQASCALPLLADALSRHDGPHAEHLRARFAQPLADAHGPEQLAKFEALLEAAVDLERVPDEYLIVASYDAGLQELAEEKAVLEGEMDACWSDAATRLGCERDKVLKLESSSQHGWYFRLSKKEEGAVRAKLASGFTQLEARKDGVKFCSKQLRRCSEQRTELDRRYERQQKALVDRVVDVAASFADLFLATAALLGQLDVLASFADLTATAPAPYTRPLLHPKDSHTQIIRLVACRHPCVEAQGSAEFVPNDCLMTKGESWFQLITGPNMGGKSTYIRQVAVCVLLAQIGCFVPASRAELTVRDAIFCRVGAGDCQLRGISTFMAEMLETASILRAATAASLVVIDELGRGTSTYDGFGLAWAIGEHIVNQLQAPALFATHFHELTALSGKGGVKNLHVAASADAQSRRLTMLYALRPGACAQSFGIHCAEFARFPAEVLAAARAKAAELEAVGGEKRMRGAGERDVAQGAAAARAFLAELAGAPRDSQQVAQARARLQAAAAGSNYLSGLLA